MAKKTFSLLLCLLVSISVLPGCSLLAGKFTSKAVSSQAIANSLYPAYKMIDNVQKWGYINTDGKFTIQPQFDNAEPFAKDGTARITQNNLVGVIDKTGKIIINPAFQSISDFSEGVATANTSTGYSLIDLNGKTLYSSKYFIGYYTNGMAVTEKISSDSQTLYGYLDKTGTVKIPLQYKAANNFYNNKALVQTQNDKYELIDTAGKVLITFPYKVMSAFSKDYFMFADNTTHKEGYVDTSGKIITAAKFNIAEEFIDGFAIVGVNDANDTIKYGLINDKGEYVVKPEYSSMDSLGQGLYSVNNSQTFGSSYGVPKAIINTKGNLLSDYKFYDIGKFNENSKNDAIYVSDETNTYFVSKAGKKIDTLPSFKGSGILALDGDLISANIDNRLSYVSKAGKVIWKADNTYSFPKNVTVKELKYNPDRFMLIYYPEVSGLSSNAVQSSINAALKKALVGDGNPVSKKEAGKYTESLSSSFKAQVLGSLLSIEQEGYDYPFGAAHGMPLQQYYHIDMSTGKNYQLSDLFKVNSSYLEKLNNILKSKIAEKNKEAGSMLFSDQFKGLETQQNFYFTKDSLNIYFSPYEIAPYAAGFPTFSIAYTDLKDIINTDGALWKAMGSIKIADSGATGTDSSSPKASDAAVKTSIDNYETGLINAINNNDFTLVEPALYKDSNLYKSQKALVPNLNKQGITEKMVSYSVASIAWNSDKTQAKACVEENVSIKYPDKDPSTKKFTYAYTLLYSSGDSKWQLSDIEKWDGSTK